MKPSVSPIAAALVIAASLLAMPSHAHDALASTVKETIALKDGSALHVFPDGKMAREDRYGRAAYLTQGESLETAGGRKITATSNEVARLDNLLRQGHEN